MEDASKVYGHLSILPPFDICMYFMATLQAKVLWSNHSFLVI
jgi:hypothetical protein